MPLAQFRKLGAQVLRAGRSRRGGGKELHPADHHDDRNYPRGHFWGEGTQTGYDGFLFGELPPPPGQTREWQWWEGIWYFGYGGFFTMVGLYYLVPPELKKFSHMLWPFTNNRGYGWVRDQAFEELEVETKMMDKLNRRMDLYARLVKCAKQLKMIEEEAYDLILMRKEYKILLGLHTGRVPWELKEIYEELAKDD